MTVLTSSLKTRIIKTPDSDLKIVNAARVSFAKENAEFNEIDDTKLIRYLANHRHWTPFSHVRDTFSFDVPNDSSELVLLRFLTFDLTQDDLASIVYKKKGKHIFVRHSLFGWANILNRYTSMEKSEFLPAFAYVFSFLLKKYPVATEALLSENTKLRFDMFITDPELKDLVVEDDYFTDVTMCEYVPIFVARQRFKHMVGTTYNEVSRRYVSTTPEIYFPEVWRGKHENKKQGSTDEPAEYMHGVPGHNLLVADDISRCVENYNCMIRNDVCPEQSRLTLPQGMMTEYYVTAHKAAWNRFINQRLDSHAQKEIQDLAKLSHNLLNE